MELSDQEMLRYHRQIALKSVDFEGQEKLKAARVLIVLIRFRSLICNVKFCIQMQTLGSQKCFPQKQDWKRLTPIFRLKRLISIAMRQLGQN